MSFVRTEAIAHFIGMEAWADFKKQLYILLAEAQDKLILLTARAPMDDIRTQSGFHTGILRVLNEMQTLEDKGKE